MANSVSRKGTQYGAVYAQTPSSPKTKQFMLVFLIAALYSTFTMAPVLTSNFQPIHPHPISLLV